MTTAATDDLVNDMERIEQEKAADQDSVTVELVADDTVTLWVKRLREFAKATVPDMEDETGNRLTYQDSVIWGAADILSALQAEIARITAERDEFEASLIEQCISTDAAWGENNRLHSDLTECQNEKASLELRLNEMTADRDRYAELQRDDEGYGNSIGSSAVGHLKEMYPTAYEALRPSGRTSLRNYINIKHATECEKQIAKLREALETSKRAVLDWMTMYAPDECSPIHVEEAKHRVLEHGTLAYITGVLGKITTALSPKQKGAL